MPKQAPPQLKDEHQAEKKWQRIPLTVGPSKDVPMLSANNVIVNFTGDAFLVTLLAAYPEPWTSYLTPPKKVEAKVLGRYAFSIRDWASAAHSFTDQIERLKAEGAFILENKNEEGEH